MKERPILFMLLMVIALLLKRKTQTRRRVSPQPHALFNRVMGVAQPNADGEFGMTWWDDAGKHDRWVACPYGKVGDKLWVKEGWNTLALYDALKPSELDPRCAFGAIRYEADGYRGSGKKRSPLFLPKWASRILLEIVSIRLERIQDITEADALAEGICKKTRDGGRVFKYGLVDRGGSCGLENKADPAWKWDSFCKTARDAYAKLYDQINGDGAWAKNEFVWVIEFRVVRTIVDETALTIKRKKQPARVGETRRTL